MNRQAGHILYRAPSRTPLKRRLGSAAGFVAALFVAACIVRMTVRRTDRPGTPKSKSGAAAKEITYIILYEGHNMLTWIAANFSTIIVSAVLIAIVALVIFSMVKNKRTGGSSCGCGCSECRIRDQCHIKK